MTSTQGSRSRAPCSPALALPPSHSPAVLASPQAHRAHREFSVSGASPRHSGDLAGPRTPIHSPSVGRLPIRIPKLEFLLLEGGQSVVLVALMFSVLMAGGAMGIDVGRFYTERRFIQDAVDSAALAC